MRTRCPQRAARPDRAATARRGTVRGHAGCTAYYSPIVRLISRSNAMLSECPVLRAVIMPAQRAAEQVDVAHDVEDLVAHELVGEAQGGVHDLLVVDEDAVVQPAAVRQAHRRQLLHVAQEAEGARRGDLVAEGFRRRDGYRCTAARRPGADSRACSEMPKSSAGSMAIDSPSSLPTTMRWLMTISSIAAALVDDAGALDQPAELDAPSRP